MSKKKKLQHAQNEIYDIKTLFVKSAKRYGIVLLIATPIIMVFSYIMSNEVAWFKGAVSFFIDLGLILFACLIGLICFTKKDDKEKLNSTKEKERDPFAD